MILDCENDCCTHCKEGVIFYCELGHEDDACDPTNCKDYQDFMKPDMVNHPNHYAGQIEVIDYIRDKLTPVGFTEYCCGNVLIWPKLIISSAPTETTCGSFWRIAASQRCGPAVRTPPKRSSHTSVVVRSKTPENIP